ncbi:nucleobase:cation symporter-2 family protein [Acidiphilium iwatense]|uniref:Purine permease n=1 Tax=Acidiphilium iwatense TaxID=768198 RepID=A0ABS9E0U9_9PROT|nr:nucleobase:cation symporter-2 family protein [Acidiphilium iwatense]MCF3947973.1 purine permease [Acidiphilium iwatense]
MSSFTVENGINAWLPPGRLFTLGLQHVLVMYAGAVAVPLIIAGVAHLSTAQTGYLISADMFCCGIGSLLQSVGLGPFGIRMPVIMAVAFTAVGPMIMMIGDPALGLPGIYGATIAAGFIAIGLAPFASKLLRFFPPLVQGIVVTAIGLNLIPVGINWAAGGVGNPHYGAPKFLIVSLSVLLFIMVLAKYGKGFIGNIAVLLGLIFGFIEAVLLGQVSLHGIDKVSWFGVITPFHFGMPTFHPVAIATMVVVMMVMFIESSGMFMALGTIVDHPVDDKDIRRGLLVDGLATVIGGTFNSFPHTSFAQNVGLVEITKVRSRWVCATAGLILLSLGLIPKISFIIASIPQFVLGGAGIVMFGMVMAAGIRILHTIDFKKQQHNSYIVAISLGISMIPVVADKFFQAVPLGLHPFVQSGIFLAALSAVLSNLWFNGAPRDAKNVHGIPNPHATASARAPAVSTLP